MPDPILDYAPPPPETPEGPRRVGFHSLITGCTAFGVGIASLRLSVVVRGDVGQVGRGLFIAATMLTVVVAIVPAAEMRYFACNVRDRPAALVAVLVNALYAAILIVSWSALT